MEIFRNIKVFGPHVGETPREIESTTVESPATMFSLSSGVNCSAFVRQKIVLIQIKPQQTQGNLEGHITALFISPGAQKLSRSPHSSGMCGFQRGSDMPSS